MSKPQIHEGIMYRLLRDEDVEGFNERKAGGEMPDLVNANLRGLDLRGMDVEGLNLKDAYLRNSDLRGIDFRNANIEGASICQAKISGCYFPEKLRAEEIQLSLEHGTRLRYEQ